MMAANGIAVSGTDISDALIKRLATGENTIHESGFEYLFERARAGSIEFHTECVLADVYIIAVPTPFIHDTKKVDVSYILSAVDDVLKACGPDCVIVVESTVSPGTISGQVAPHIDESEDARGKTISLAHAPERILPGNMIYELTNNPRIVGADDEKIAAMLMELYSSFCKGEIRVTDVATAEMSKVAENTYRDVNIAYANELLKICNKAGMDAYEVIRLANMHPRVNILHPGPGVGGHCIPVDPWFLVGDFPGDTDLILSARRENDSMPSYVYRRIRRIMGKNGIEDVNKVGLYGLTYKENIDDVRESPTLALIDQFVQRDGIAPLSYDPHVRKLIAEGQVMDRNDFFSAVELVVIMVPHRELLDDRGVLSGKAVLDARHCLGESDNCKVYEL
jgi:UDP-N-acetyl-D-mannosaminuronic acid dehydrogenase